MFLPPSRWRAAPRCTPLSRRCRVSGAVPRRGGDVRPCDHRTTSWGRSEQAFVDMLRAQLHGRSVSDYAVNAPAAEDFTSSAVDRGERRQQPRRAMVATCPNTRIVLAGYSQGALVIDLLTALPVSIAGFQPAPLPPEAAPHIAAVVVFGNPARSHHRRAAHCRAALTTHPKDDRPVQRRGSSNPWL